MAEIVTVVGGAIMAVAKVADVAKGAHDRSKHDRSTPSDCKHNKDEDAAAA